MAPSDTASRPTAIYCLYDTRLETVAARGDIWPIYVGKVTAKVGENPEKAVRRRFWKHQHDARRDSHLPAHRAIQKYSTSNIVARVLDVVLPETDWRQRERDWIAAGRRVNSALFNLAEGGEGSTGFRFSAETRAKMSAAAKSRVYSPETRAKISKGLTGRVYSPETRAKISAANKERSPEARAKFSAVNKGRVLSPETRAKIGAGQKGRKHSPETLVKMSAARKNYWTQKKAGAQGFAA